MPSAAAINYAVLQALAERCDDALREEGWARTARSLDYRRNLNRCAQRVNVQIDAKSKDVLGVGAAICPSVHITLPDVEVERARLLGLETPGDVTWRGPIDWSAAKTEHGRWLVLELDGVTPAVDAMFAFWRRWLSPFLAELDSAAGLLRLYDAGDPRLVIDRTLVVALVAAARLERGPAVATEIADRWLGKPGPRRLNALLFENLAKST
jgi:hypothetical protein